jgi:hypothetical protein
VASFSCCRIAQQVLASSRTGCVLSDAFGMDAVVVPSSVEAPVAPSSVGASRCCN